MAGLRERKKRATRDAIVRSALALFAEHGYAATSVAQIAEAADVSPATFFVYFPAKEDVVFADQQGRIEIVSDVLRMRSPDESVAATVRRALHRLLQVELVDEGERALYAVRGQVVAASLELRAAAAGRLFVAEGHWAAALRESDPALDELAIHATLGAALGAAIAAATAALEDSRPVPERVAAALDVVLGSYPGDGLSSQPRP